MDREEFKLRMKSLKSYRELNPGKGYWDWKVEAFQPGGVTGEDDPDKELKRSLGIAEYILKYDKMPTDDSKVIDQYIDKVIWPMENPNNAGMHDDGLYYVYTDKGGDGITRKNIGPGIESHSNMGKKLKYDNSEGYTKEELNDLVLEDMLKGTARIVNSLNTMQNGKYYGVWDTLSTGPKMTIYDIYHNVKAGRRGNLPEKWPKLIDAISKGNLEEAKKQTYSGSARRQKLRNGLLHYALGGETGNDDNERVQREINQMLGRTYYGVPLELGLKPVINIEDAANFTPIGDAMAVRDTYNAVKNNDWITAGLAAAGVLPFVPSGLQRVGKIKRATPEVHKNTQDLINAKVAKMDKAAEDRAKFANEQYRIVERVMEDPSYINRAAEVKLKFGDDYSVPYADMFFAYNVDPSSLPQVTLIDDLTRAGTMGRTPNGFVYGRNPNYNIPNVGEHELSHFTDLLKSGRDNAEAGNNMFYQMSKDLTKKVDSHDNYFLNPSEQKAHMNQLREWMFLNGYINTRDLKVTPEYMSKILKQLDNVEDMKGVKRASLQFKSNRTYTKWFNQIPLIGTAALGANAYFTNNNKE